MAEPAISDAMIKAFIGVYGVVYVDISTSVSAETMDAQHEATAAGLRAAVARYLTEQRTLGGLATQQGVRPIGDVTDLGAPGGEDAVELLHAIHDRLTDHDRAALHAAQLGDGRPAVVLTRHRYVRGDIAAKCDRESAMEAARLFGGRVDRSTVVAYECGEELLGQWQPTPVEPADTPTLAGYEQAIATLRDVAERTGSPAARWAADYLAADPDRRLALHGSVEPMEAAADA